MRSPSIGRIVLFEDGSEYAPGVPAVAPAIITRVWSDTLVNLWVFPDASRSHMGIQARTSVPLYAGPDEYAEAKAAGRPMGCYWPPRV